MLAEKPHRFSRKALLGAAILAVALTADLVVSFLDSVSHLQSLVRRGQILVYFNAVALYMPGVFVALLAASLLTIARVLRRSFDTRTHWILQWLLVVGLPIAVITRFGGTLLLDGYMEKHGYHRCSRKSEVGIGKDKRAWALSDVVCQSDSFPEDLTVEQANDLMKAGQ